jgi:hypothetical protein
MQRTVRRHSRIAAVLVAGLVLAIACATPIKTAHDSDPDVDVSSYQSYAWISDDPLIPPQVGNAAPNYISPIDDGRIRGAVERELGTRGYIKTDSREQADLVVSYAVAAQQKLRVRDTPGRSSVYYGGYGHGPWYGGSQVSVQQYTEGTLSIELWDRRTKKAVWVGWASKRLSSNDDSKKTIDAAVTKILEPLPPSS